MGWEEDKDKVMSEIEKISGTVKTFEELTKQVRGQEELTQKFKQEVGDMRKALEDLGKKEAVDPEIIKKLVDKVDKLSETNNGGSDPNNRGGADSDKDWDERKLSEAGRKKADEVFNTLSPEQRVAIKNDPSKRNEFLKAAHEATETAPVSLFDEPKTTQHTANEFRKLFGIADKDANIVPGSISGTGGFMGTGSNKPPVQTTNRLVGGVIPREKHKE